MVQMPHFSACILDDRSIPNTISAANIAISRASAAQSSERRHIRHEGYIARPMHSDLMMYYSINLLNAEAPATSMEQKNAAAFMVSTTILQIFIAGI